MKDIYKVGDVVITRGYSFKYDGIPLKIKRLSKNMGNTYAYFHNPFTIATSEYRPTDNFNINHVVEKISYPLKHY